MYKIGLTGSIASGKTAVRQVLNELGYPTIDADEIAHRILESDDDLWARLVQQFGDGILDAEGRICRSCLARLVFSDDDKKDFLERSIHPLIIAKIKEQVAKIEQRQATKLVFIEAALLFETGLDDWLDEIWYIEALKQVQISRLIQKRHFSKEEALLRIEAIAELSEEQMKKCRCIDNSGTFEYTKRQVESLLATVEERFD